jgi:UDP-2,3-diacylglucosamine pyrophosphatase LpxH
MLYLVGDIIDGWRLRRSWFRVQAHNDVIQKILIKARKGTRVVYVPGNHDELLRGYTGLNLGNIAIVQDFIHDTADGRRFLVMHGDRFDGVVRYARWLAILGDWTYAFALHLNHWLNVVRRHMRSG